ncbi:MAG: Csu type fimbrial protein [Gammaproteobacteria bacterium]
MKLGKISLAAVASALLLPVLGAQAATDTGSMNVRAQVADVCIVDTVNDMDFLSITPGSAANYDASASILWRCSNGTAGTFSLDKGVTGADISSREMAGPGTGNLAYQLYSDTTRSTVFGDGATGSTIGVTGSGMSVASQQSTSVYGRVLDADAQNVEPGAYADTVTVTLTF